MIALFCDRHHHVFFFCPFFLKVGVIGKFHRSCRMTFPEKHVYFFDVCTRLPLRWLAPPHAGMIVRFTDLICPTDWLVRRLHTSVCRCFTEWLTCCDNYLAAVKSWIDEQLTHHLMGGREFLCFHRAWCLRCLVMMNDHSGCAELCNGDTCLSGKTRKIFIFSGGHKKKIKSVG